MSEQRQQRDNDGVIFVNDRKENDRQPDYTGKAMVDGRMYYVSGWTKQGRNGDFYTLAFKPMDEQQAPRDSGDQRCQSYADARGGGSRADGGGSPPRRRQPAPSQRPAARGPAEFPDSNPTFRDADIPFAFMLPERWI